jgi:hypothetical protein
LNRDSIVAEAIHSKGRPLDFGPIGAFLSLIVFEDQMEDSNKSNV